MLGHREQRPISGDYELCLRREGGCDHHVVVDVGCDPRNGCRPHKYGEFGIPIYQLINGQ